MGFAPNEREAYVIPLWTPKGNYWDHEGETLAYKAIKKICESDSTKIFQNGIYDVTVAVGDVAFPSGSTHRITVESTRVVSDFVPSSKNATATVTSRGRGADGKITLDAAGGTGTAASCSANGNPYNLNYNLGRGLAGNPNLQPEISRSFTGGVIFQPVRWLSLTVDYYNVRKKNLIVTGPDFGKAVAAYYNSANAAAGASSTTAAPGASCTTAAP